MVETVQTITDTKGVLGFVGLSTPARRFGFGFVSASAFVWAAQLPRGAWSDDGWPKGFAWNADDQALTDEHDEPLYTRVPWYVAPALFGAALAVFL